MRDVVDGDTSDGAHDAPCAEVDSLSPLGAEPFKRGFRRLEQLIGCDRCIGEADEHGGDTQQLEPLGGIAGKQFQRLREFDDRVGKGFRYATAEPGQRALCEKWSVPQSPTDGTRFVDEQMRIAITASSG